jgi:hypothetical protein
MSHSEKDRLAVEFEERWIDFQMSLSDKRKYPVEQFRLAWEIGRRYAEMIKHDALIHRVVANAVNGMTDFLTCERKRVPEEVVLKAQRLSRWFSRDTTRISKAMSLQDCSGEACLCCGEFETLLFSGKPTYRELIGQCGWKARPEFTITSVSVEIEC